MFGHKKGFVCDLCVSSVPLSFVYSPLALISFYSPYELVIMALIYRTLNRSNEQTIMSCHSITENLFLEAIFCFIGQALNPSVLPGLINDSHGNQYTIGIILLDSSTNVS